MALDPVEEILAQFGRMRAQVQNEINRLPGPEPLRNAFRQMDSILSKTETKMVATARKVSPLNNLGRLY
jgi:hypothetical protein